MARSNRRPVLGSRPPSAQDTPIRTAAQTLFRPSLPLWKKLAFAVPTALAILMVVELTLWACGVKPAYFRRDPYAGFTPQVRHFQDETDPGKSPVVTVVPSKRETLNEQRFPRHKPPGTFRIVCLGGSATYGRPFFDHTSFAGWLRAFLPKADPSRKWEVINAGAISYASYRVRGLMAELARYEPDLFIAYMGHNEFLERRTYAGVLRTPSLLRKAAGLASGLRITTVMQSGLELAGILRSADRHKATGLHEEVVRIPVYSVGPEAYTRDETFKREVLSHYEASLNAMVDLAAETKARLLFVTP
ncbi:MAG: SGNH/GDSL hydrolase family protein, partial [Isosphaeraceae bacterium]